MSTLYQEVVAGVLRRTFPFWQALGVHVTPNHFYQPIPDTRRLSGSLWQSRAELPGVDLRRDAQLALVEGLARDFGAECRRLPNLRNRFFEGLDAQLFYSMVRSLKPRRIIEVGCGWSTTFSARAIAQNRAQEPGYDCAITAIDPYPPPFVLNLPEVGRVLDRSVQEVPLETFEALGANDILFVDSSHVFTIGSDVQHLLLRVLPRLSPGVLIHFHDVFLPAEYPRDWVFDRARFWNEQHALHAFMAFNRAFRVELGGQYLHQRDPDFLDRHFPNYAAPSPDGRPTSPGSFWIRRV